jgi:hypothetical protein
MPKSTLQFDPDEHIPSFQDFFATGKASLQQEPHNSLILDFYMESIDFRTLGKLLVLNGRCRTAGYNFLIRTSSYQMGIFRDHQLHRIINIEETNT